VHKAYLHSYAQEHARGASIELPSGGEPPRQRPTRLNPPRTRSCPCCGLPHAPATAPQTTPPPPRAADNLPRITRRRPPFTPSHHLCYRKRRDAEGFPVDQCCPRPSGPVLLRLAHRQARCPCYDQVLRKRREMVPPPCTRRKCPRTHSRTFFHLDPRFPFAEDQPNAETLTSTGRHPRICPVNDRNPSLSWHLACASAAIPHQRPASESKLRPWSPPLAQSDRPEIWTAH
jgi:hypothetical protein